MKEVITYSAPNSNLTIDLTPEQVRKLEKAHRWPRANDGTEYCRVSHGLHTGKPTYTDTELANEVGLGTLE